MFNKKNCIIPLDNFINQALYNPTKGYYMQKNPFGKNGDFITAPNISKIFSEMILLWLIAYWKKFYKNKKINIVELGAGNGEMMAHIIYSAKRFKDFYGNCNFIIFEKSNRLIKFQKKKLRKENVKWLKNLNGLTKNPTIFLGNEFLDALPIKQFVKLNNVWHERYVEKNGNNFNFTKVKYNIKNLEKKLKLNISKNQKFLEIPFDEIKILKKLNLVISKNGGCILMIDYANLNNKMFDSLQAVKKHKKVNILKQVGTADISHVINIPFLKKIAKKLNLDINYSTQRKFLLDLGILQRAEMLASKKKFLEKANIFYRIDRLIDEEQMGELFKVIHFHKQQIFKLGF